MPFAAISEMQRHKRPPFNAVLTLKLLPEQWAGDVAEQHRVVQGLARVHAIHSCWQLVIAEATSGAIIYSHGSAKSCFCRMGMAACTWGKYLCSINAG
jgi:hypothetical protein